MKQKPTKYQQQQEPDYDEDHNEEVDNDYEEEHFEEQEDSIQNLEQQMLEEKKIKRELSMMPFEVILSLQKKQDEHLRKEETNEKPQKKKRRKFKSFRKDKTGPLERDARKPVPKIQNKEIEKKQPQFRDPRFDHLSGKLRLGLFHRSYEFLGDLKKNEIGVLQKQMRRTKDKELKAKISTAVAKNKDELKRHQIIEQKRQIMRTVRDQQHINPNKSIVKREMIKQQFTQLEQNGKLDKFLASKRKKHFYKIDKAFRKVK